MMLSHLPEKLSNSRQEETAVEILKGHKLKIRRNGGQQHIKMQACAIVKFEFWMEVCSFSSFVDCLSE
jgi:hypothetical protein